jgi:hypothetical protein
MTIVPIKIRMRLVRVKYLTSLKGLMVSLEADVLCGNIENPV